MNGNSGSTESWRRGCGHREGDDCPLSSEKASLRRQDLSTGGGSAYRRRAQRAAGVRRGTTISDSGAKQPEASSERLRGPGSN